jgi:hypothetical protein
MLRARFLVLMAVIVLAPLSLLLIFPAATFQRDWTNNLWMIAYMRDYLLVHGVLPDTFNVAAHVGIAQPIFYGPLLYPCLAVLSVPLGASVGLRVACVIVWTMQSILVYRAGRVAGGRRYEALAASALVSWSVYALTNLYNRGAIAEFMGTSFLLSAVAAGALARIEPDAAGRRAFGLLFTLLAAMALGSHAPTALVGGFVLAVLCVAALPLMFRDGRGGRRFLAVACMGFVVALVLSPWVYVTAQMSGRLSIQVPSELYPVAGKWQRFLAIDSWQSRLEPLPLAGRAEFPDRQTPYVDAQWNFPLAVLAVWNMWLGARGRREFRLVMFCSAVACVGLLIISISPALQMALPRRVGGAIQFPYRLVSHVNLLLFALLIAAWAARAGQALSPGPRKADLAILVSMMVLAGVALGMKLTHAADVMTVDGAAVLDAPDTMTRLPDTYAGQDDYTLQIPERLLPGSATMIDGPRGLGPREDVADASYVAPGPQWVATSILNFPWNRLVVDGKPIPFDEIHNIYFHEAVELTPGAHTLGYRFEPDRVWVMLGRVSWIVLAGLAAATLGAFALNKPARRGPPRPSPGP